MTSVTLDGQETRISGDLPEVGAVAPAFNLLDRQQQPVSLDDFSGRKLLNIFPKIVTPVCGNSVRKFNQYAEQHPETPMLMISADSPEEQQGFCSSEGLSNVIALSAAGSNFGEDYGVRIMEGMAEGCLARSVLVLDEDNKVLYRQLVPEIGQEPDYDAALAALKG